MEAAETEKPLAVQRPTPEAEGNAMLRFTLVTGAWFVGLFGLMRLP